MYIFFNSQSKSWIFLGGDDGEDIDDEGDKNDLYMYNAH